MKKISTGARIGKKTTNVFVHILLAVLSFIWVLPILFIIIVSFKSDQGLQIRTLLPDALLQSVKATHPDMFANVTRGFIPTLDNYKKLFTDTTNVFNFPQMFVNTLIISIFSCIISAFFVLSVSYVMSRMRFKMRKPFMNVALILGMFPGFMSMIAVYYILKSIGLTEGAMIRVALIMVYSGGSGLGFYIAKGFFDTVPKSLTEAAILDGCNQFQVFYKIILPLSKPIVVYTILTAFLAPWLDFVFVRVIVGPNDKYWTVSLLLYNMLEKEFVNGWFTRWAAAAVVVSIPISILFVIMQRFYVDGLTGAVKG